MKSYKASDGTIFHYYSDMSCDIISPDGIEATVDGQALKEFFAYCYIAPNKIRKIEQMDFEELLEGLIDIKR